MAIFINIEQEWSFKFFEFNRPLIAKIDNYFHFCDDFYASAMKYVLTQINFQYGMTSHTYNQQLSEALSVCDRYPELAVKIKDAFVRLHTEYRIAYNALGRPVRVIAPVVEATGILLGIMFTLDQVEPSSV